MPNPELCVRHVKGRYPHRGVLRSDNIVTSVVEIGRVYRVRLDDAGHDDAWLEITIEVTTTEVPCAARIASP